MSAESTPRRALSFDSNPPFSVPMRFFFSAVLFAILASAVLIWQGEAALLSRWSPSTLALTHLLVLGCLSMAMLGALLQMLPVVAGISLPQVERLGPLVHLGLCAGTLLLASAFWWQIPALFIGAAGLLAATLLLFLGACSIGLWRTPAAGATEVVSAIRHALSALLATLTLGLVLVATLALPQFAHLPWQRLTDLHVLWGLLGWVGLLVMGIAWQVVPMFMVTEPYPPALRRHFSSALFLLLCASSVASALLPPAHWSTRVTEASLMAGCAAFASVTLYLLAHRKRPSADTTTLYWRYAMLCVLLASLLATLPLDWPLNFRPLALGVLMIAGVAMSAIYGMLYKIVPFLTWYHLQETRTRGQSVPTLHQIIPAQNGRWQFGLHATGVLLLLAACYAPAALSVPAGAVMALASSTMLWNLLTALRLYRRLQYHAHADDAVTTSHSG
ncbi:MAG: permease [Burkholderiaceae bacterium]|nr:permease [Burkholderiaceae bacterium]